MTIGATQEGATHRAMLPPQQPLARLPARQPPAPTPVPPHRASPCTRNRLALHSHASPAGRAALGAASGTGPGGKADAGGQGRPAAGGAGTTGTQRMRLSSFQKLRTRVEERGGGGCSLSCGRRL